MFRSCSILFVSLLVTGCVSLSKYNERVEQIKNLNTNITSLEEALKQSESARSSLEAELQQARQNFAKLQEDHENLKSRSLAALDAGIARSGMDAQKQNFANDMASLITKLADAESRIRELTATLATKEETAKRIPILQSAIAEREQRIKEQNDYMLNLHSQIAQMKKAAADLSRQRNGSEEKEFAFTAMRANLSDEINRGEIVVKEFRDKLIVSMKEQVLFTSGSAKITKNGQKTLNRMAKVLKKIQNNQIIIEGHTDTTPIGRKIAGKYPTNWDLAAARATNVLKHLEKKGQVESKLLALAGYGCYLPAAANDCAKNKQLNRRIEIALVPLEMDRLALANGKIAMRN